jgi:hypothetical protein
VACYRVTFTFNLSRPALLNYLCLLREPLNYNHYVKLYERKSVFQLRKIHLNSYPLPLVHDTASGIREIRTGRAGRRCGSPVQVLLSAKRVVSQRKGDHLPGGKHDGCMAKTFAHSNSRTFL